MGQDIIKMGLCVSTANGVEITRLQEPYQYYGHYLVLRVISIDRLADVGKRGLRMAPCLIPGSRIQRHKRHASSKMTKQDRRRTCSSA